MDLPFVGLTYYPTRTTCLDSVWLNVGPGYPFHAHCPLFTRIARSPVAVWVVTTVDSPHSHTLFPRRCSDPITVYRVGSLLVNVDCGCCLHVHLPLPSVIRPVVTFVGIYDANTVPHTRSPVVPLRGGWLPLPRYVVDVLPTHPQIYYSPTLLPYPHYGL